MQADALVTCFSEEVSSLYVCFFSSVHGLFTILTTHDFVFSNFVRRRLVHTQFLYLSALRHDSYLVVTVNEPATQACGLWVGRSCGVWPLPLLSHLCGTPDLNVVETSPFGARNW